LTYIAPIERSKATENFARVDNCKFQTRKIGMVPRVQSEIAVNTLLTQDAATMIVGEIHVPDAPTPYRSQKKDTR